MSQEKMRFSKKIIALTMACTIIYAVVYLILCFKIGILPDYSFNAGIFAALSIENWCNAWIKTKEYQHKSNSGDNTITPPRENISNGSSPFTPIE